MDKLKLHTPDLVNENIANIAALFPTCVTESRDDGGNVNKAIDFDQLRQELSDRIVEGSHERYQFEHTEKGIALGLLNFGRRLG